MRRTVVIAVVNALVICAAFFVVMRMQKDGADRAPGAEVAPPSAGNAQDTAPDRALVPPPADGDEEPGEPRDVGDTPPSVGEDSLAGRVVREDGTAVWHARVRCLLGPYVEIASVFTNRRGEFAFKGLDPAIVYCVEATRAGHMPQRVDDIETGRGDVEIVLSPGARLSATVLSSDVGMPLDTFTVALEGPDARTLTFSEAAGRFVIEGLAAGTYTVSVSAPGYADAHTAGVHVPAGGDVTLGFLVPPEGEIEE